MTSVPYISNYIRELVVYRSDQQFPRVIGVWLQMNIKTQRSRVLVLAEPAAAGKTYYYMACKMFKQSKEFPKALRFLQKKAADIMRTQVNETDEDAIDAGTSETMSYLHAHERIDEYTRQIEDLELRKASIIKQLECKAE